MNEICFWIALAALPVIVALYAIHRIERGIERAEAQMRELEPEEMDEAGTYSHPWGRRTDEYDTQAIERAARQHKGRAPAEHERSTLPKAANDSSTEASDRPQRRRLHRV